MVENNNFKFIDNDIEESIELKFQETLYLYDLNLSFGVLNRGKLLLIYETTSGSRIPLKIFSKEGFILGGYVYFLEKKSSHNLYFIALEDSEILKVSGERSRELLSDKNFLLQYLKSVTTASFSLIEELTYRLDKNIEKFLAYILLNYSEDKQIQIKNFTLFAEFIKCSRSHFYLALGKLIDKGIVKKSGKTITILDWKKLSKLAEL